MAAPRPGPTDSILDVAGLHLGQVELGASGACPARATGVTAVVVPAGALGVVDVLGATPGMRETDTLSVLSSGERVHAVLLVGRSVFGLAAADGATTELERRGIGLAIDRGERQLRIPIVASAVIFDFLHGDPAIRPGSAAGVQAVAAALDGPRIRPRSGNAGAGAGAATGGLVPPRLKGGVGHASLVAGVAGDNGGDLVVGAVVVVNSSGSPVDAAGRPWASVGGFDEPDRVEEEPLDQLKTANFFLRTALDQVGDGLIILRGEDHRGDADPGKVRSAGAAGIVVAAVAEARRPGRENLVEVPQGGEGRDSHRRVQQSLLPAVSQFVA
jgi:L-aminopeptidase/D-esterase-like protein